jgi:mxaC protein
MSAFIPSVPDFASPWMLCLLPLALLPLLPRREDTLPFSWAAWLPPDRAGRVLGWISRTAAALALAAIVVGLAGPGRSHLQVQRTGRGAEILILMDRSGSMNGVMASRGINVGGESKNSVARAALAEFVDGRPNDRFAFMMFGISPVLAVPFTYDHAIIRDAIAGTAIGRGTPDTQLGRGLIAAIGRFDDRPWTGHRAIVMVSDGGAQLSPDDRRLIGEGLARNRIALYFIYLRSSVYGGALDAAARAGDASPEAELHRYFLTLRTPYHLFEAGDPNAMTAAMNEISRQQNFPISFVERLPRQDLSGIPFAIALGCCALLLLSRMGQVRSWI